MSHLSIWSQFQIVFAAIMTAFIIVVMISTLTASSSSSLQLERYHDRIQMSLTKIDSELFALRQVPTPLPPYSVSESPLASPCPSPSTILAPLPPNPSSFLSWQTSETVDPRTAMPLPVTLPAWLWGKGAGSSGLTILSEADMLASRYLEHVNAQDREDQYLVEKYFWARGGGIILESGALDGIRISTSLMFNKLFGWKAIHIDANPRNYARLIVNRPDALNIHVAICHTPRLVHWLAEPDPVVPISALNKAEIDRLSNEEKSSSMVQIGSGVGGIYEFMARNFIHDFYPNIEAKGDKAIEGMPMVACRPLAPLLSLFGISHIHVWVLDVEGAELEVLKAVDFSAVVIDVIFVEADGGNPGKDAGVISLLNANGFIHEGNFLRSDWFVRSGFVKSSKP